MRNLIALLVVLIATVGCIEPYTHTYDLGEIVCTGTGTQVQIISLRYEDRDNEDQRHERYNARFPNGEKDMVTKFELTACEDQ